MHSNRRISKIKRSKQTASDTITVCSLYQISYQKSLTYAILTEHNGYGYVPSDIYFFQKIWRNSATLNRKFNKIYKFLVLFILSPKKNSISTGKKKTNFAGKLNGVFGYDFISEVCTDYDVFRIGIQDSWNGLCIRDYSVFFVDKTKRKKNQFFVVCARAKELRKKLSVYIFFSLVECIECVNI